MLHDVDVIITDLLAAGSDSEKVCNGETQPS